MKLGNTLHDIVFGMHSGIPLCCIWYFVTEWEKVYLEDRPRLSLGWGYVPCLDCERSFSRKITVHKCSEKVYPCSLFT